MQQKIIDFFIGVIIGALIVCSIFLFYGSRNGKYQELYIEAKTNLANITADIEATRKLNFELTKRNKELERLNNQLSNSNTDALKQCGDAIEYNKQLDDFLKKGSLQE